ncbi:MAG: DUF1992 domain-containing protein [Chloroflexi bacterium]|nr:MAG: DUF1992 domain-containing protein [Chloroflexota bacterium]
MFHDEFEANPFEEAIRDAINGGDMSGHPLQGQPLSLDNNPYIPEDSRMAYKILKDNQLAPDWIIEGQSLDKLKTRIHRELRASVKYYRGLLADAQRAAEDSRQPLQRKAEATWQHARRRICELLELYNRRVLTYNLKVPAAIGQRPLLNADALIEQALRA